MKLTKEQRDAASAVVKDGAATMSDTQLVLKVKEVASVDVNKAQIAVLRRGLGLKKTRGRKSRLVEVVAAPTA